MAFSSLSSALAQLEIEPLEMSVSGPTSLEGLEAGHAMGELAASCCGVCSCCVSCCCCCCCSG